MTEKEQDPVQAGRAARLDAILQELSEKGVTQRDVALEVNVPPNYLSDLRHGRRVITDQFCRTFAQVFQLRYSWLAEGAGAESAPQLAASGAALGGNRLLPVLPEPCVGDPQLCPAWDGSQVEIAGAAVAAAARAINPYLLRFSGKDKRNRLQADDLILVSQGNEPTQELAIARKRDRLVLVRRSSDEQWLALETDKPISGKVEIVGQCLGVVWSKL